MDWYTHDSVSGGTSDKYIMLFKLWLRHNHNMQFPQNTPMFTGRIVEGGLNRVEGLENYDPDKGRQDGMPIAEATRHMLAEYDEYQPT